MTARFQVRTFEVRTLFQILYCLIKTKCKQFEYSFCLGPYFIYFMSMLRAWFKENWERKSLSSFNYLSWYLRKYLFWTSKRTMIAKAINFIKKIIIRISLKIQIDVKKNVVFNSQKQKYFSKRHLWSFYMFTKSNNFETWQNSLLQML